MVGQIVECSFKKEVVLGLSPVAVTSPSDFAPASRKEFFYIQATIECGFTLKRVRHMTRTYSQRIFCLGRQVIQLWGRGSVWGLKLNGWSKVWSTFTRDSK